MFCILTAVVVTQVQGWLHNLPGSVQNENTGKQEKNAIQGTKLKTFCFLWPLSTYRAVFALYVVFPQETGTVPFPGIFPSHGLPPYLGDFQGNAASVLGCAWYLDP